MAVKSSNSDDLEFQDEALADLAEMFVSDPSDPSDPTPGSALLDASRLDYSVDSLGVVDQHLEVMRGQKLKDDETVVFVLRCGAYVGEVIRRQSSSVPWHWLDNETANNLNPNLSTLGQGLGTAAVLWDGADGFCFPLGKVGKFLENGADDSVKFFANVIISGLSGASDSTH